MNYETDFFYASESFEGGPPGVFRVPSVPKRVYNISDLFKGFVEIDQVSISPLEAKLIIPPDGPRYEIV